jgi:hypothetical protein
MEICEKVSEDEGDQESVIREMEKMNDEKREM